MVASMTNDDLNTFEGEHDNNSLSSCLEICISQYRPDDSSNLASFNIASGAQYIILYWEIN